MSDALHQRWGRNIRNWREYKDKADGRKGSGIDAMAIAIGVTPETVSRWETGKLVPRDARKMDIAEYLGVPAESLFPLVREVTT